MSVLIGLMIGMIGFSLLYLGKGIQKYAIEGYKLKKGPIIKNKNTALWICGTLLTTLNMFVHWVALLFAPVNIIAPLEGIGLIVLILFSYHVLKENITRVQIFGIIWIIIGTFFVTFFNINTGILMVADFDFKIFINVMLLIFIPEVILSVIMFLKNYKVAGIILGITAGSLMALQTITKRLTAIPDQIIVVIFSIITFIVSTLTLIVTQIAFTKGNANIVIPCFTSASIILAVLTGYLALSEYLLGFQILGIGMIIFGVVLLTALKKT